MAIPVEALSVAGESRPGEQVTVHHLKLTDEGGHKFHPALLASHHFSEWLKHAEIMDHRH
jgi:hypothetical protein